MTHRVDLVDVRDEAALRAWWEVGRATSAARPADPWPAWEASRLALSTQSPERLQTLFTVGTPAVGAGLVSLPRNDNAHLAFVDLHVHPEHRRRAIGSALMAEAETRTRAAGRTTMLHDGFAPPGGGEGLLAFAARHGFEVAGREQRKVVTTADGDRIWPALEAEAAAHADGYRIVRWVTDVPDEHVEAFCRLLGSFYSHVPLGDVDLADSEWTAERIHSHEERYRAIGMEFHTALALAPDGSPAGCSDARVSLHRTSSAAVGLTLVLPEHRGHRLGLALKLATHRAVQAAHPECQWLDTTNSTLNTHMNAINERMGYRVVEDQLELQKRL